MPKITNIKNTNFIILVISVSCFVAFVGRLFPQVPVSLVRWVFTLVLATLLLQNVSKWVVFLIMIASLLGQILGHWDWLKTHTSLTELVPFTAFIPVAVYIWRENVISK